MCIIKKLLLFIFVAAQIALLAPLVLARDLPDASGGTDDIEAVLLFDVSGSMNNSDPVNKAGTRMSIEAAYQFVFNYPSENNMFVSVVPYHSYVYADLDTVNVSTEKGLRLYDRYMKYLLENDLPKGSVDSSIYNICWRYQTDIGGALEAARDILDASSCGGKKAVILFTDGTAQLESDAATADSEKKAKDAAAALRDAGIPVYSIGLNYDGSVNRGFLNELSGEDNTAIVTSTNDLTGVFAKVYTDLVENSMLRADGSGESHEIGIVPDRETVQTFRIIGDAVKEANISFSGKVMKDGAIARLSTVKVSAPGGTVVAEIDVNDPAKSRIRTDGVVVNYSPSGCSATVKLIEPMDGEWTVAVKGEEGTVVVKQINLFDLEMQTAPLLDKIYVGDTYDYEVSIYNSEKQRRVTSPALFVGEDCATAIAEVKGTSRTVYEGKLNESGSGFGFSLGFVEPGEYEIATTVSHTEFELKDERRITVLGPQLMLTVNEGDAAGTTQVQISLFDPAKGEMTDAIPGSMMKSTVVLHVMLDGEEIGNRKIPMEEFESGMHICSVETEKSGAYSFRATLDWNGTAYESDTVGTTVTASEITPTDKAVTELVNRGTSGKWTETVAISAMFADSDGDKLTYRIEDGSGICTVDEATGVLTVQTEDFGEWTVKVHVTDEKGAEYVHRIVIMNKSVMPVIVICAAAAAVLAAGAVVFLIIMNKKRIVAFPFRLTIDSDGGTAEYEILPFTRRRSGKPRMTLSDVFGGGFATLDKSYGLTEDEVGDLVAKYGAALTFTGVPFRREMIIAYSDPAKKAHCRRRFNNRTPQTVRIGEVGSVTVSKR